MKRHVATIGDAGWRIDGTENWEPIEAGESTVWIPSGVSVVTDPAGVIRIFVEDQ